MDLWIKDETILLINGYKKVIRRKTTCKLIALQNYKLTVLTKCLLNKNASGFCLKSLMMQADLMSTEDCSKAVALPPRKIDPHGNFFDTLWGN